MFKHRLINVLFLLLILTRCSTAANIITESSYSPEAIDNYYSGKSFIYGGVRNIVFCEDHPHIPLPTCKLFWIDLPLSFTLDTAFLPFTVPWQLYRNNKEKKISCSNWQKMKKQYNNQIGLINNDFNQIMQSEIQKPFGLLCLDRVSIDPYHFYHRNSFRFKPIFNYIADSSLVKGWVFFKLSEWSNKDSDLKVDQEVIFYADYFRQKSKGVPLNQLQAIINDCEKVKEFSLKKKCYTE